MRKEALHILRDPRSLYMALGVPVLLLVLFGYAITFDIKNIPVGIIDHDRTETSRNLISQIDSSPYFDLRHRLSDYSTTEEILDRGEARFILGIPSGFAKDLAQGKNAHIQVLIDGSDNNSAQVALGYVSGIVQKFSSEMMLQRLGSIGITLKSVIPPINIEPRIWYNPSLRSANFIVPGLIAVVMMAMCAMLTSLTVAREWEAGTMEQLIASPIRPHEIIIGKLLPYYVLGLLQAVLIILVGTQVFQVPLKGNILFLFATTSLFLLGSLGIGLFISAVTRSQQLSFMLSIIITFLPSFLLSGFIFPVTSMPWIIRVLTHLVPARYFLIILRGIFLKDVGFSVLRLEVGALAAFAFLIILACAQRLKLRLE
jgi:ABC-2 type transport system permease protein